MELQEENLRLRKAVDELSFLNDLARVISSTTNPEAVIEHIVKRSLRLVHAQQGMIIDMNEDAQAMAKTRIRVQDSSGSHHNLRLNERIRGYMYLNKKPLISNDMANDSRLGGSEAAGPDLTSLLCVPLLVKNRLIGILAVCNKKEGAKFTDEDARLLSIVAMQSGQVLENARLYEQERLKMEMDKDLIAAHEVQMYLLPRQLPQVPQFEFAAVSLPALEVGGDFYDFISLDEKTYEIILADVAGKGLPAALLASLGKGVLFAQALQHRSPKVQIRNGNFILRGSLPRKSFITMMVAVIDTESREVTIANAGHCFPLLYRAATKTAEFIQVKGMPFNFTEDILCEESSIQMEKEDFLVIYSDGVLEAQNPPGDFFGKERLCELVVQCAGCSAGLLLQKIIDEIKLFAGNAAQSDDITLVVMKAREALTG
jgi:sigma-B regulation protein RsbU (phosphoserine phosphatase)